MTGAQFEIRIDGTPRSYRDRKDLALQGAQILKSRNPNSVVRLKDLESGEEIVIAFKVAQTITECSRCRSGRSLDWLKFKTAEVRNPGAASLHQRTQTQRPPPRWQTRLSG